MLELNKYQPFLHLYIGDAPEKWDTSKDEFLLQKEQAQSVT